MNPSQIFQVKCAKRKYVYERSIHPRIISDSLLSFLTHISPIPLLTATSKDSYLKFSSHLSSALSAAQPGSISGITFTVKKISPKSLSTATAKKGEAKQVVSAHTQAHSSGSLREGRHAVGDLRPLLPQALLPPRALPLHHEAAGPEVHLQPVQINVSHICAASGDFRRQLVSSNNTR